MVGNNDSPRAAKRTVQYVAYGVIAVVLIALLIGQALEIPVLFAYVTSGSMAPTLETGDGFIAVPSAIASDPAVGDVVVFRAERLHGGELTTHRIIDVRPGGYVTQGDANFVSDQSSGEPLVTDGQIVATALTIDGTTVRIPHLGTAAATLGAGLEGALNMLSRIGIAVPDTDRLTPMLFVAGILTLLAAHFIDSPTASGESVRDRSRRTERPGQDGGFDTRWILVGSIVVLCFGAMIGMTGPAGTETIGIVSSQGDSSNPTIVPVGGSDSYEATIYNGGLVPTISYFESRSDGIDIEPAHLRLAANETATVTVTLHAPDETGYFLRSKTEHRYFAVLPAAMMDALYQLHPWLPYAVINALLIGVVLLIWQLSREQATPSIRVRTPPARPR
ncbi:signal peptidase I [Halorubrum vacuolatum]|uniref:Signal peptidase, endoplasmic reticulum-type n=1 Tax=Halorubrum vacuolatum TaxID=63740 RepID=A0A238X960_HALVU|nr:signal peptidase I [Halorubrum vacuolatum]SNR55063.1 signal peptidase, endoplasmic reticulum-type [Halorubrum vacuolatum]